VTVEQAGEGITRHAAAGSPAIRGAFDRGAANSALGLLELEFNADTTLTVGGALNFEQGDHALDTMIDRKLSDTVTVSGGVPDGCGAAAAFLWRMVRQRPRLCRAEGMPARGGGPRAADGFR
jgi:hypothetical protein